MRSIQPAISVPGAVPRRLVTASSMASHMGVCTMPGLYTLTVMPCSPSSSAAAWLSPRTANFDAEYAPCHLPARWAATDAAPMSRPPRPWAIICRAAAR